MPRGGYREKAGRKTTWASGCKFEDTKIIRVPKAISNEVLEIAHKLDAGKNSKNDLVTKTVAELIKKWIIRYNTSIKTSRYGLLEIEELLIELKTILSIDVEILESREKEIVTNSKIDVSKQLELLEPIEETIIEPITQTLLAKRLNIPLSKIRQAKGKIKERALSFWSSQYDPDGVSWKYDIKTKKYIPSVKLDTIAAQKLAHWIKQNL